MSTPSQRQCLHQYFFNGGQIGYSMNFCFVNLVLSYRMKMDKPFLPLYPIVLSGGFNIPDTVVNMQTLPSLMYKVAQGCKSASDNYVSQSLAGNQYEAGEYGNYLNLKVNGAIYNQYRFDFTNQIAYNFIRTLNPATTSGEFITLVNGLVETIKLTADPRSFLAPGEYYFADLIEPDTSINTYLGTSPNFKGFAALEIDSII